MRFGVHLPHFGALASGAGTLRLAQRAETLGYESVWVADHIVYPRELTERFGAEFYEAVTTLAFVAAHTAKVTVGTAVLVLPYRHPVVLAKQLATLDALAGGRLIVGVGAGWLEEEYRALGAPFEERGAATDEALHVMRSLWSGERAGLSGKFPGLGEAVFAPRPLQPPRVWVGGNTARALRRAAELGDGWLPIWHAPTKRGFTPEALRDKVAELAALRRQAGRAGRAEIAALMPLAITDTALPGAPQPLVGAPEAIADTLRRYRDAGLEHVILSPYYGLPPALSPKSLDDVDRVLSAFAADVRPRL
ncbi:MAG: TIGR03619 family F420-dependent LLM class oxidoreductase [Candidatus Rokuibacteriota bacterium]